MSVVLSSFKTYCADLETAADLYARVWNRDYETTRLTFIEYVSFPHFCGWLAWLGDEPIGFALGTESRAGQWWHDCVSERVGTFHPALYGAFVLTELAVLAPYRSGGVGKRLHDTILSNQPLPRALLSTMVSNHGALRFYHRLGWQVLHPGFAFFEGGEPYTILHRNLRT
jgi:ribosomal protein S18 acetylase RimI-like enzyme